MDLYIYNRKMELLGVVDEINSLIWTRRYSACGEVKMLVVSSDKHAKLLKKEHIIMRKGYDEAAEITGIHIEKAEGTGVETIEVEAKFLLNWLGRRVVIDRPTGAKTSQNLIYEMVRKNVTSPSASKRKIPELLISADDEVIPGQAVEYGIEETESVLFSAELLAREAKIGIKVKSNMRENKHYFSVYKGRDLTETSALPCIFSEEYESFDNQEYSLNTLSARTTAYVGGEIKENVPRKVVLVGDETSGIDRSEVYIDASDMQQQYTTANNQQISMSNTEYENALKERGKTELASRTEERSYTAEIAQNSNLRYRVDYDLGDRVTCINKRWGVKLNARITEITETYENNGMKLEIVFGESAPTLFERIRQIR